MGCIYYNKTKNLPLISKKQNTRLGKVDELIIDFNNGNFLGLTITKGGILSRKKFINLKDIFRFDKNAVVLKSKGIIRQIKNVSKIGEIIRSEIKIKNNKAITQSGQYIGTIKDFEVDLDVNKLSKLIVGKGIIPGLERQTIPYSQIISIKKEAIVVRDVVVKVQKMNLAKADVV